MERRTLLKIGLLSGTVLTLAGGGLALWRPGLRDGQLTEAGREVFAAIARAVLDGTLPTEPGAHMAAVAAYLDRLDATLAGFAPATQAELGDLVTLLASPPGRLALVGLTVDWPLATTAQLQSMLQDLRLSSLALRQQTYHALRDLTNAAYFADPGSWPGIGYDGPLLV